MGSSSFRFASFFAATSMLLIAVTGTAYGHPAVDEGKRLLRRARFERAAAAFARAEAGNDLTRSDLMELLEARCMLYLATQQGDLLEEDLAALASIDPEFEFGREAPPELQDSFGQAVAASPGPLQIEVQAEAVPGGIVLSSSANNDPASVVRRFRTWVRTDGGDFTEAERQRQDVPEGVNLEYYIEALGPGGAVIKSAGSAEDPRVASAVLGDLDDDDADEGGGSALPWILAGVGVAAAAAAVVIVILVTSGGGTQPQYPMVVGF